MKVGALFFGLVWGAAWNFLVVFMNINYDAFIQKAVDDPNFGLMYFGAIGFLLLSIVVLLILILIGIFSRKRRGSAFSTVFGFGLGQSIGALSRTMAPVPGLEIIGG